MILVGLTGLMGSGKSTVLNMFRELGAAVYNADIEAKKLMHTPELILKIKALFGDVAFEEGVLNRAYISKVVFDNPIKLKQLNGIVHPAVKVDFEQFVANSNANYVVYESALLFQSALKSVFDIIVVVSAPAEDRILRIMQRDKSSREAIEKRLKHQSIPKNELKQADFIIERLEMDFDLLASSHSFFFGDETLSQGELIQKYRELKQTAERYQLS